MSRGAGARRTFFGIWILVHALVFSFGFVNVSALGVSVFAETIKLTCHSRSLQYALKGV